MPIERTSRTENSEEARAFLQARLGLFWKFLCWFMLVGTALALVGAFKSDARVSVANTLTGTPQYMAPESIADPDTVDGRADLYGLGAVAYFLLAGGEVFRGRSVLEVCSQHLHQEPDAFAARGVNVSAELEAVVLSCLAKDPALRPQSAAALRARLAACPVTPWDDESARRWWDEHQAALDGGAGAPDVAVLRTIAVDGAIR